MSQQLAAAFAAPSALRIAQQRDSGTQDLLGAIVAQQIVPRLMRQLRPAEPAQEHEAELTRLVLSHDAAAAAAWARGLLLQGMPFETLCLGVLAPAARRLGQMWLQDVCDFADVTLGTGRLQHVMHMLAPPPPIQPRDGVERRALLVAMPGEQHTFGLSILAQAFRMAGWEVATPALTTLHDLSAVVTRGWFGLVGLSVGSQERLSPVAGAISAVRAAARPYGVRVMLGGPIFPERPHLAAELGADLTAADAPSAVRAAETMLDRMATLQ